MVKGFENSPVQNEGFLNPCCPFYRVYFINYLTPYQRHYGLDKDIIENRKKVYEKARAKHPERWSRNIRDWSLPECVALNPLTEKELDLTLRKPAK
ncbi:MAG: hypothetical protein PHY77_09105 [Desulfotomaculaceae bacterium]|nr:hypothetical protein [Desulfotomaculaceae bacterium]